MKPPMINLPPPRWVAYLVGLAAGAALIVLACTGCKGPEHAAAQSVRTLQQLRDLTGKQLGAAMRAKHAECKAKHGAKTEAFAVCVKPVLEAHDRWRQIIRPSMDTAAQAGGAALATKTVIDACKKRKDCIKVIFAIIKPGVCALLRGLRSFGRFLSDKGGAVLDGLKPWEGVTCAQ